MSIRAWFCSALTLFSVVGTLPGEETKPTHADAILGTWKMAGDKPTEQGTITFTKDGKIHIRLKGMTKPEVLGTYRIKGEKLITTIDFFGKSTSSQTIKKLTDTKLTLEDDQGKAQSYERVPEKNESGDCEG